MEKSDLMGRFDFDGAEGIAFWVGDSDTEPIAKVMFDELETLKAFIEHNLPGMFGPEIESRIDDRDYWYGIANIAKSQRDTATEAIERVRAIHLEVGRQVDDAGVEYTVCKHCTEVNRYGQVRWPCRTIRALEGEV